MIKEETIKLLGYIRKIRPYLFNGLENESRQILEEWCNALSGYSQKEVDELLSSGHYIPHYNYTPNVLQDLIRFLGQQRYEKSAKGVAEKDAMIAEWYRRHPRKAEKEEKVKET